MNDMKCPICNDGKIIAYLDGTYECDNYNCSIYNGTHTETFEALIRTHRELDFAVDVLKEIDELLSSNKFDVREVPLLNIVQTRISMLLKCINTEQITAPEQKDVK